MVNGRTVMKRRDFLIKSALFAAGGMFGAAPSFKPSAFASVLRKPRIAVIIDDIGFSRIRLKNFLDTGVPLTFSILPGLDRSFASAEEIHCCGHEIMLHQPMEPFDSDISPGPGAIYVGDSPERIAETMEKNLSEIPHAAGINNHMGSKFTSYGKEMEAALNPIKKRGLFFIDSLTTSRSKGYRTAINMDISAARRNIFLDLKQDVPFILRQLEELRRIALEYGSAIGIGHPFPETARAVKLFSREIKNSRVSLMHASNLMRG